jgi:hypothetical protein
MNVASYVQTRSVHGPAADDGRTLLRITARPRTRPVTSWPSTLKNYLAATTLGGTRYATMIAAGKKNKLKMKYPMKL